MVEAGSATEEDTKMFAAADRKSVKLASKINTVKRPSGLNKADSG